MVSIHLNNATRTLAKDQPEYNELDVVDIERKDGSNHMLSLWKPTPEELEMLNNNGVVALFILGTEHPPVIVQTQSADDTWRLQ